MHSVDKLPRHAAGRPGRNARDAVTRHRRTRSSWITSLESNSMPVPPTTGPQQCDKSGKPALFGPLAGMSSRAWAVGGFVVLFLLAFAVFVSCCPSRRPVCGTMPKSQNLHRTPRHRTPQLQPPPSSGRTMIARQFVSFPFIRRATWRGKSPPLRQPPHQARRRTSRRPIHRPEPKFHRPAPRPRRNPRSSSISLASKMPSVCSSG